MVIAATFIGTPPDLLAVANGHYQYYKKPVFVRMEFIHPHDGALLLYNPIAQRVRLWFLVPTIFRNSI